jgi:glycosyltransferase involved in cell wall biosynthesis
VVVPFYNESENITSLIEDLNNQSFPGDMLEIILVDDFSEDDSYWKAGEQIIKSKNIRILKNKYNKGKKYALKTGVENARSDIIVTADADCRLGENWVAMSSAFFSENPETKLLSSGVIMRSPEQFSGYFQSLEFTSLVASGAASFIQGSAIMCNGANLAFRKDLFLEAFENLYPGINSGDDIFLMLYAKKKYPGSLQFLKSLQAFTFTKTRPDWMGFLKQRLRWSSKSSLYRDGRLIYVAFLVLIINFILLITLGLSFFNICFGLLLAGMLILKSVPDYIFLRSFLRFSNQETLLKFFIPSQLINIFFIPVTGILGLLYPLFRTGNK